MAGKLFIVEDEFIIAQDLRRITTSLGFAVMGSANNAKDALKAIDAEKPDLVLLDINILGDTDGIELSKIIKTKYQIPYIYITSYADTTILKRMNDTHPFGYVLKPFDERDIRVSLELAFATIQNPEPEEIAPKKAKKTATTQATMIGSCEAFTALTHKIKQVAATDVTVLIEGETGVGKELVMESLHAQSGRSNKKVVKVNCAALPADLIESVLFGHEKGSFTGATEKRIGKFELANGGTIFLDEIGELPLQSQSKLLRCLQEKEIEPVGGSMQKKIDVRVIAATNRDLSQQVNEGLFRADLFFRLNIFPIRVPTLVDRKEDIIDLANYFLEKCQNTFNKPNAQFSEDTLTALTSYSWPGNIRELQHYVERAVLMEENDVVTIALDNDASTKQQLNTEFQLKSLEDVEREQIILTLQHCGGKIRGKGGAAEILKLHPNTLDFRIKKLGIVKNNLFE